MTNGCGASSEVGIDRQLMVRSVTAPFVFITDASRKCDSHIGCLVLTLARLGGCVIRQCHAVQVRTW